MGGDPCKAASIKRVKIENVDDKHVTFLTRSASRTGDRHECLLRSFTVPRSEVYTAAIKGAPPPVELKKNKLGALYLSRAGWETTSDDGYAIFGKHAATFKIPDCAAASTRMLTQLRVIPTSIVIRGHLEGAAEFFDLELLGPDAGESQAIDWNGADYIDVRLTPRGAKRLRLKPRAVAKIWPISIVVKGNPAIDQAVSGEVDLLNDDLADGVQELEYRSPGAGVRVTLTQAGVNAFHLTPQVVAELSQHAVRVVSGACHGCAQREVERTRKRAAGATRRRSTV
jgi:hypothetical protein